MIHKNFILPIAIVGLVIFVIVGGFIIFNSDDNEPAKVSEDKDDIKKVETHENDNKIDNPADSSVNKNQNESFVDQGHEEIAFNQSVGSMINASEFIEESEKDVVITKSSTFEELKRTSDLNFVVGEKYFYHEQRKEIGDDEKAISLPYEYDTIVEVNGIERINGKNYYTLQSKNVSADLYYLIKNEDIGWEKRKSRGKLSVGCTLVDGTDVEIEMDGLIYEGCTWGINKDEVNERIVIIKCGGICELMYEMYAEWMLYIDKNVRWIEKQNGSMGSFTEKMEREYAVVDIEKINGRECFKVKIITKFESSGTGGTGISNEIDIYWVDIDKRILVKREKKIDNILTEATELIKYEPA